MWNPLVLSREPIATALPPERAAAAIDEAFVHGVRGDGWHRDVDGSRKGSSFEFALTQLRLSEVIVARGTIEPASCGSCVRYMVGPPLLGIVAFWVFGGLASLGAQARSLEIVLRVALKPVLESTTPSKRPIE